MQESGSILGRSTLSRAYYTSREAQEYLRIGKSKLFQMIREGELTPYRVGARLRFDAGELHARVRNARAA